MNPAIADRIAKCDAPASSSIPGEAAAACAMAKRLREKYGEPPRARQSSDQHHAQPRSDQWRATRAQYDRAAAAARTRTSEYFEAQMGAFRERLDHAQALSAAEAFNARRIMCVAVEGGWLLASTGTKILSDFELVSFAHRTVWATFESPR